MQFDTNANISLIFLMECSSYYIVVREILDKNVVRVRKIVAWFTYVSPIHTDYIIIMTLVINCTLMMMSNILDVEFMNKNYEICLH